IPDALNKVLSLRGVNYQWNKQTDDRLRFGFVAQEVEEILPEFVSTDSNGIKSVNYTAFSSVLVEAVKEQQKQIEELKLLLTMNSSDFSILTSGLTIQQTINGKLVNLYSISADGIKFASGETIFVNDEGYIEIGDLAVRQLKIKDSGSITVPSGNNEISGSGMISQGTSEITITNENMVAGSKVFITFEENPAGPWWVKRNGNNHYFTVNLALQASIDLKFQYLILKTDEDENVQQSEPVGTETVIIAEEASADNIILQDASADTVIIQDASADTVIIQDASADTVY
ncbi:MAG: tail fiber domain-containing protein, partial [Patescibacteria group bacterium]